MENSKKTLRLVTGIILIALAAYFLIDILGSVAMVGGGLFIIPALGLMVIFTFVAIVVQIIAGILSIMGKNLKVCKILSIVAAGALLISIISYFTIGVPFTFGALLYFVGIIDAILLFTACKE